jgi:hypothetical protein
MHTLRQLQLECETSVVARSSGDGAVPTPDGCQLLGDKDRSAGVASQGPSEDPYLIPGNAVQRRPGDRDDRVVWRLIRRVAERAGVKTTVHALRAAFAVAYLEQMGTEHLFSLQQLMGHSRPETTNLYLRRLDRRRSMETVRGLDWGVRERQEEPATKRGRETFSAALIESSVRPLETALYRLT